MINVGETITVNTRPKGSFNYYVTQVEWGVSTFPGKSVTKVT